jgi:hypothetical protein
MPARAAPAGCICCWLTGGAVLDAAGIDAAIGAALSGVGYASDGNFTTGCEPELYVTVTREARQAGRSADGRDPAAMLASSLAADDRLAGHPRGQGPVQAARRHHRARLRRLFARLDRHPHYRDGKVDLELARGPSATTCSRPSAPAGARTPGAGRLNRPAFPVTGI